MNPNRIQLWKNRGIITLFAFILIAVVFTSSMLLSQFAKQRAVDSIENLKNVNRLLNVATIHNFNNKLENQNLTSENIFQLPYSNNDSEKIEERLIKLSQNKDFSGYSLELLFFLYTQQTRYSDSLKVLQKILRNNPDSSIAYQHYARLLILAGRNTDAIFPMQAAIVFSPSDPLLLINTIKLAIELGEEEWVDYYFNKLAVTVIKFNNKNNGVSYDMTIRGTFLSIFRKNIIKNPKLDIE